MRVLAQYTDDLVAVIRWVARIIAAILAIYAFIFVSSEGRDLATMSTLEIAKTLAFAVVWLGLIATWRWDGISGMMIVGGALLFYLFDFLITGTPLRLWVFSAFLIPGLMMLYCSWQTHHPDEEV